MKIKLPQLKNIIKEIILEHMSNYKSLKNWPDGIYKGIAGGYEVYSDEIDAGFKTINGVRGSNIPCNIYVKNGEAFVKTNGVILFSSEKAKKEYKNFISESNNNQQEMDTLLEEGKSHLNKIKQLMKDKGYEI